MSSDVDAPIWLSHHWPGDHDRCLRLGSHLVCRRCLVLYPVAAVAALVSIRMPGGHRWDPLICWLLPVPALVELAAEQIWGVAHRPRRLVVVTVLAGVGAGRAMSRYLMRPSDHVFWLTIAEVTVVSALVIALGFGQRRRRAAGVACDGSPAH